MTDSHYEGIAIIGLTGRFPGAVNVDEYWRNLVAGVESISTFSDAELAAAGLDPAEVAKIPDYVRARGLLADADCFDAPFFGINPKEAEATDPQQRVFLEAAWSALESAGYVPDAYRGAIGLFAGMSNNTYYLHNLHGRRDVTQLVGWLTTMMGNEKDYLATRVAYKLNLKGPALNLYTACSTSLVAVCQAVQQLQSFACDIALAGGVSISFPQHRGYQFQEGGITSPDGHCRAFDANAAGTVFSHGLGVVVLKRLAEAVADGDHIYAVIKGAALNNDGAGKVSFTAPSVDGQAEVIALAQAVAGIEPDTISYVEAHGTATPLGDPIEVAALTQAFRAKTSRKNFCGLGTVKSNLGHLDVAAGVAGLIKTALALKHRQLPPSLHFTRPNPKLELESSPFYVVNQLKAWQGDGSPLRAGVSSFGVGGTNAHVVLEEAPAVETSSASRPAQLLLLSAKSSQSLAAATGNLAAHFQKQSGVKLADAAFTLQVGRAAFPERRILVCREAAEAATALTALDPKSVFSGRTETVNPPVVFMFPGQGAQYVNMGLEIYRSEPSFRADVDRCAEILKAHLGLDLRDVLYPPPDRESWATEQLIQTRITQPALFVIEYALAKLWMSWGIKPAAMIGHSVGEYVAGCLAGVFTLEAGLELVAGRARLVQAQPPGAMLSVRLPEAEIQPLLGDSLSIAAINSPALCVVSGPHAAVEKLERELEAKQVMVRRLHTSHAFHSAMMDPVLPPFTELLRRTELRTPQLPYVSNVTARWVTATEATDPNYWAGHVRQAVRFADGLAELFKNQQHVMLEVGPGQTLAQLARQHPAKGANQTVLSSLATAKEQGAELTSFLTTLGRLWLAGVQPDWEAFYANEKRHRIPLPTYAFEKKRYWVEPNRAVSKEIIPWASPPAGSVIGATEACATPAPVAEAPMQTSAAPAAPAPDETELPRSERILKLLTAQLSELSGLEAGRLVPTASFLELGFDSLFLTQASLAFQKRFGVKVTFRQLLEDLPTLKDLAGYLDSKLAADALPAATPVAAATTTIRSSSGIKVAAPAESAPAAPKYFGPFKPIDVGPSGGLTERQQKHLNDLIARYTKRTPGSKATTARHRTRFADPRAAAGFKQLWKEMVYPIVTQKSEGAKLWDVDGNEYVDVTLGFGLGFLGHRPPFVVEAIEQQLAQGMEIGPSSPLAGEVAAMMTEVSGLERVTFCNTGSEAVTAAIRIARTVSGRNKIVTFAGAYHGIFDEVLVRPQVVNEELRSLPIAPGIVPDMVNNVIVLEYGDPQSLEIIAKHGDEIAAVLVEPVQSRRPDLQPRDFLQELRQVTERTGSALVFDETVTGFRCHPRGAQAWFGVQADIATYGKVVGGGLPIGICCGRAKYMDALDGGNWQYGDASFPEVGVTFFAGTFVRHPLALAAAKAVLTHLKEQGGKLQQRLNETTEKFVAELNAFCQEVGVPIRLTHFSSMIYPVFAPELKYASLLFYHLREKGIHVWEGRPFFLSTAHTDDDVAKVVQAFKATVKQMQAGGFFPEAGATVTAPVAEPVIVPLTEMQEEMWLAAEMGDDASRAMNDTTAVHMRGALRLEVLQETLQALVDRHDALRTTYLRDGTGQRILAQLKFVWSLTDLTGRSEAERPQLLDGILAQVDQKAFNLATGPLLRAELVRLASDHHVLILTAHHSIVDGWSVGVLLHELSLIYSARVQGLPLKLEPALQYRDYAEWQQSPGYRSAATAAEAYWISKFADGPAAVELPTDHARPARRTFRASQQVRRIEPEFHSQLKQASRKQGCTLLTYLMASFNVWLRRTTGQEDLIVGIPAAGQIATEALALPGNRGLVGHCVNLLPIRSRCTGEATFADYVADLKRITLDAYEHQNITFGTLVKKVKLARDSGRVPLVSVTFNVDRAYSGFRLTGLETQVAAPQKHYSVFDLGINIVDYDTEMRIHCRYNNSLFKDETVQRWLGEWLELLQSLVANPAQPVLPARQMSPEERQRILVDWNQTAADFPRDKCLHHLFEEHAARTPEAVALILEDRTMTYGDLNRRANQVAHHLIGNGVGPETLVAVLLDRSFEMVVSLLGILKAGGAFVPLDTAYPAERLAFVLADTQARWVLTHSTLVGMLPSGASGVIRLDSDWPVIAKQRETNPATKVAANHLAYVIYTSGSTGQPKGVMIEHRSIVNHLAARQRDFPLRPEDRFLQKASFSFDISVWEIFAPLATGAQSVLATPEGQRDSGYLSRLMARFNVSVAHFGPALMQLIVTDPEFENCKSLRRMFCGGEPLSRQLQELFFARNPNELISQYGPTEATVDVTWCRCDREQPDQPAPIGRPMANTQAYILDPSLQPVPVGVAAELHIGGVALARGYLNRPELTAEKFIANPFDPTPGARLYRTGDICRYRPDGLIEFIGRTDHQIKIRGYRVELGEIEAVLQQHPDVVKAVVDVRADGQDDKRLLAYVQPRAGATAGSHEFRDFLRARLPDYMVPMLFATVGEFPLTPNGKVDRRALAALGQIQTERTAAYVAPATEVETALAAIWSEVLGVERVGTQDDFFELGGHSLLAARVTARVRRDYGVEYSLGSFLRQPTVAAAARAIEELLLAEISGLGEDEARHQLGEQA